MKLSERLFSKEFEILKCPMVMADGYKLSHAKMYPEDLCIMQSNFTPRNGKHRKYKLQNKAGKDVVVVALIQKFVMDFKKSFDDYFFNQSWNVIEKEFNKYTEHYLGETFDISNWRDLHSLGYIPLNISALPEGTFVPYGVPLLSVRNTDERFAWLVNYFETLLSCSIWHGIANATTAAVYQKIVLKYYSETSNDNFFPKIQCHDFSMRGMTSYETAINSGLAHLMNFYGTDTFAALPAAVKYYNANIDSDVIGCSVPASEHSVMTIGILKNNSEDKLQGEKDLFIDLITNKYPRGIISVVADSYDYFRFLEEILGDSEVKEIIEKRDGKVVIRPDSGNVFNIICGYHVTVHTFEEVKNILKKSGYTKAYLTEASRDGILSSYFHQCLDYGTKWEYFKIDDKYYRARYSFNFDNIEIDTDFTEAEIFGSIRTLDKIFGHTINEKGYKVLNEKIGLIYGDSITPELAQRILETLKKQGYSSENIVFGIGSYSYQMAG